MNHSSSPKLTRRRRKIQKPVGSSPGTLMAHRDAQNTRINFLGYSATDLVDVEIQDISQIPELIKKWTVSWIQVTGLANTDIVQKVGETFNLHRLTLEDVTHTEQRPKIEKYDNYSFIVARVIDTQANTQELSQISIFLGKNFVLSFAEKELSVFAPLKNRIVNHLGRIRGAGADYLCYAILDCIIDQYFPTLEAVSDKLDQIENGIHMLNPTQIITSLHTLRHDLLSIRRAIWPLRDVINSMIRDEDPLFVAETRIHLRDCYDHVVQIIDFLESYRELGASLMELSLSLMSHRLNEGIRILTVISTVFIPLNFIAGVYGMNFNTSTSTWNMPELNWKYGYFFALSVMALVTLAQLWFFKRKGWLSDKKS